MDIQPSKTVSSFNYNKRTYVVEETKENLLNKGQFYGTIFTKKGLENVDFVR